MLQAGGQRISPGYFARVRLAALLPTSTLRPLVKQDVLPAPINLAAAPGAFRIGWNHIPHLPGHTVTIRESSMWHRFMLAGSLLRRKHLHHGPHQA